MLLTAYQFTSLFVKKSSLYILIFKTTHTLFVTLHKNAPVEKPVVTCAVLKCFFVLFNFMKNSRLTKECSNTLPTLFALQLLLFVNAHSLTLVQPYKLAFAQYQNP